ncbi:MAG: hypothetical protein HeimC2_18850 [Candidatus Heimdallarchaeota archaeon LC_2]|nr:MAG: hypothetical protein HeimC2_18850 [Candidatus Heimdallarchaeota archaeon LC_2]
MVNEVVMYQSMFLLGIIAFGFFSFTFDANTTKAEDLAFESNLEILTQDIGQIVLDLVSQGKSMMTVSSSFEISVTLFTQARFSGKDYTLKFDKLSDTNEIIIVSSDASSRVHTEVASFNTGIVNGSSVSFDSSLQFVSAFPNQSIAFIWDGITATVLFQKN